MRALALGVAMAVALAGCGSDSSSSTTAPATSAGTGTTTATVTEAPHRNQGSDQRTEIEAIPASLMGTFASDDPSLACDTYVTERYLKSAYGNKQGCVAAVRAGVSAPSVRIESVRRTRTTAFARVIPSGGPNAGATLKVSLVLDGDLWKVDAARANIPVGP